MKKELFSGIDASNEISLLEYGLLVYSEKHEDNSCSQFCVYRIGEDSFGTGHIYESDINSLLQGDDWMCKDDIDSFMSSMDIDNINEYITNSSLTQKIFDLVSYYGIENIFGIDYSPISESEAIELYLS